MYIPQHGKTKDERPARFKTTKVRNLKISISIVAVLWIVAGLKLASSLIMP